MAFEDAVILAKALRDSENQGAALKLYEQLRRPRTQHNITASAAMTGRSGAPLPASPISDEELARQLDWESTL